MPCNEFHEDKCQDERLRHCQTTHSKSSSGRRRPSPHPRQRAPRPVPRQRARGGNDDIADDTAVARRSNEHRPNSRAAIPVAAATRAWPRAAQPNFGDQTVMRRARSVAWDVSTAADAEPDPRSRPPNHRRPRRIGVLAGARPRRLRRWRHRPARDASARRPLLPRGPKTTRLATRRRRCARQPGCRASPPASTTTPRPSWGRRPATTTPSRPSPPPSLPRRVALAPATLTG